MTDQRKPNFKITLTISNTTLAQANPFDVFSRFKAAPDYYDYSKQPELDFEASKEDDWEEEEPEIAARNKATLPPIQNNHRAQNLAAEFMEGAAHKIQSAFRTVTTIFESKA